MDGGCMANMDTRLQVVAALGRLMERTGVERIRVTDLCQEAQIARSTFYANFHDVQDVATWFWDYLMDSTLYQAGVTLDYHDAHMAAFGAMREHRAFLQRAASSVAYNSICQHGGREMGGHLIEVYVRKSGLELTEVQRVEAEFYNIGAKHATRHWMARGMQESPEVMTAAFERFVPRFMLPFLEAGV